MNNTIVLNILSCIFLPLCIIANINPFIITFICGIASANNFIKQNKGYINTIVSWNLGFLAIIGIDGLLYFGDIIDKAGYNETIFATLILNFSLFIINILYVLLIKNKVNKEHQENYKLIYHKHNHLSLVLIILMYLLFLGTKLESALQAFASGRGAVTESEFGGVEGSVGLLQTFIRYIIKYVGFILPAFIYHYIYTVTKKRNTFISLLIISPIFLIDLFSGVRYVLLFSLGTFLVTYSYYNRRPIKNFLMMVVVLAIVFVIGNVISAVRHEGLSTIFKKDINTESFDRTQHTMQYMSMVVDYYNDNTYEYGSSLSSLVFFWIPRSMWPEKPTFMGYWFIREYYGVYYTLGPTYSAPASYISEAYADFGLIGVLILSLLLAYILVIIDVKLKRENNRFTFSKLILFFLVPGVFFLPRQLNQTYLAFIGIFILLKTLEFFAKKKTQKLSYPSIK